MRWEKPEALLMLARRLAGSAEGMTLDDIAEAGGCNRRTAERMRDALARLFPQMTEHTDGRVKRFRIPGGLDAFMQAPGVDELTALAAAADTLEVQGAEQRARALRSLEDKVRAAMRAADRRRLSPDVEALVRAQTAVMQPGPRPAENAELIGKLTHALMAMRAVRFIYRGGSRPGEVREVAPWGLIFGRVNYLVGADLGEAEPKTRRLDRILALEVLDKNAGPPEDFDLQAFADRSFGVYQDEVQDIVLSISPEGAEDALGWRFHPTQTVEKQADGSVLVSFRASGMLELSWHLFTWGDKVTVVEPARLKERLVSELETALAHHRGR
ncbi:MAG: WYL domain-containing protein [Caulobacteraceae bacterium]|nr:WYL domain-containing protein [Caulobacteraceae bacterium]